MSKSKTGTDHLSFLDATGTTPEELRSMMIGFPEDNPSPNDVNDAKMAYGYLRALYGSFDDEKLEGILAEDIGFSIKETKHLIGVLASDSDLSYNLAKTLMFRAKTDPDNIATAISDWRRTEEAEELVSRSRTIKTPEGKFSNFLSFVAEQLSPSLKAEHCAKFDLYCRSGWAEKDISDPKSKIGKIFNSFYGGKKSVDESSLKKAFKDRFEQLFVDVRIQNTKKLVDGKIIEKSVHAKKGIKKNADNSDEIRLAPPGYVDAVIVSPEGDKVLVGIVTSRDSFSDGTQVHRHKKAIEESIADGTFRSKSGVSKPIDRDTPTETSIYHLPVVTRRTCKEFKKTFGNLSQGEIDTLNFLSFMSAGGGMNTRGANEPPASDEVLACRQALIGVGETWDPAAIPAEERALVAATLIEKSVQIISRMSDASAISLTEGHGKHLLDALNKSVDAIARDWHSSELPMMRLANSSDVLKDMYGRHDIQGSQAGRLIGEIISTVRGKLDWSHEERLLSKNISTHSPKPSICP